MKKSRVFSISKAFLILCFFCMPAYGNNITVTTSQDSDPSLVDGKCSLREAIEATNTNLAVDSCAAGTNSGSDTIDFFIPTPAVITLVGQLTITDGLIINGLGPNNLTIDANNAGRHFEIDPTASGFSGAFTFNHLKLINGLNGSSGGSIRMPNNQILNIDNVQFLDNATSSGAGGAISVANELTNVTGLNTLVNIKRSSFFGNTAQGSVGTRGGAVSMGIGSVLDISQSTFADNHAEHINGNGGSSGALHVQSSTGNPSMATIRHSTFNGNSSSRDGGAISAYTSADVIIEYSTIVGNTADTDRDDNGDSGGLYMLQGTLTIKNSIIAGNQDNSTGTDYADIYQGGVTITSNGYNFIGENNGAATSFPTGSPNGNNDFAGNSGASIDPLLLPLVDNGGPTQTMAVPGPASTLSLVVDNGNCAGELYDQRTYGTIPSGVKRAFDVSAVVASVTGGDNCDIGAYEFGSVNLATSDPDFDGVNTATDTCPDHFDPKQELVCKLEPESDDGLCVPVKTSSGAVAVICL